MLSVVIAGGAGSRLWPLSRMLHPKPFVVLNDGQTLLQKTYSNHVSIPNSSGILTILQRDMYFEACEVLSKMPEEIVRTDFLLEQEGRDTAPAILAAALYAREKFGGDMVLFVTPADHIIEGHDEYMRSVKKARELAIGGKIVTFGIQPTSPEIGYGYIEYEGFDVLKIVEKPDRETAECFLKSGRYLWNAGMFCFRADIMISEFEKLNPEMVELVEKAMEEAFDNDSFCLLNHDFFSQVEKISIDYAIMEKTNLAAVVPTQVDWNDVGAWPAMAKMVEPDADGNQIEGEAFCLDSKDCYIKSPNRLTATVGVQDLLIVDTQDALLVAQKDHAQGVKTIFNVLKEQGNPLAISHSTVYRPWGSYTVLHEADRFKIKNIVVKPKAALSLQKHYHRSEHWVIASGTALVENGDQELLMNANESTFIPCGQVHRLSNPGLIPLHLIEVQCGEYLDEDDIVRLEDHYGRNVDC